MGLPITGQVLECSIDTPNVALILHLALQFGLARFLRWVLGLGIPDGLYLAEDARCQILRSASILYVNFRWLMLAQVATLYYGVFS